MGNRKEYSGRMLKSPWIEIQCLRCGKLFPIHRDWEHPPKICKKCKNFIKNTNEVSQLKKKRAHFIQGGAPGTGRKR